MASYAESEAVFKARCLVIGLEEAEHEKLAQAGLKTLAQFAFCSAYVPGGSKAGFVKVREPSLGQMVCLRRLRSEGYGIVAAKLKQQLESGEDSGSRSGSCGEGREVGSPAKKTVRSVDKGADQAVGLVVRFLRGVRRKQASVLNKCTLRATQTLLQKAKQMLLALQKAKIDARASFRRDLCMKPLIELRSCTPTQDIMCVVTTLMSRFGLRCCIACS